MVCSYASLTTKEPDEDNHQWKSHFGQKKLLITPVEAEKFTANCIYLSLYSQSPLVLVEVVTNFCSRAKTKPLKKSKEEIAEQNEKQYSSQIKIQDLINQAQENICEEYKVRRIMRDIRTNHDSLLNGNSIIKRNVEGSSGYKRSLDQQQILKAERLNGTIKTCKIQANKMIKEQR